MFYSFPDETKIDIEYSWDLMALWRHMASWTIANVGSSNVLLIDGTKPLPEPKVIYM